MGSATPVVVNAWAPDIQHALRPELEARQQSSSDARARPCTGTVASDPHGPHRWDDSHLADRRSGPVLLDQGPELLARWEVTMKRHDVGDGHIRCSCRGGAR